MLIIDKCRFLFLEEFEMKKLFNLFLILTVSFKIVCGGPQAGQEIPNFDKAFSAHAVNAAILEMAKSTTVPDYSPKGNASSVEDADEESKSKLKMLGTAGLGIAVGGAKLVQSAVVEGTKTFSQIDPILIAKVTGGILIIICGRLVYLKIKNVLGFDKDLGGKKARKLKRVQSIIESVFDTDKSIKTSGLGFASVLDNAVLKKIHILTQDQISMDQRIAALEEGHRLHQEHIERLQSTVLIHDRRLKALEIQKTLTSV